MAESLLPSPQEIPGLLPARGSVAWRAAGDLRMLNGSGYALLLQVAHPTVGAGVSEHSNFAADPWGRLLRTLDYVNGTIYGGPEMAAQIGQRVRAMHTSIKGVRPDGERYHALEPRAYAWVHATLAKSIYECHRWFARPMSASRAETFWGEWRRLGRLIGVRDRDLPGDWAGFEAYFEDFVATELEDTPTVHEVLEALERPIAPPLPGMTPALWRLLRVPAASQLRLTTLGLLGPDLRERFGLEWSAGDDRRFRALAAASRASGPAVVGPLREFGPVYVRWRRRALARGDVARPRPAAA